MLKLSCIRTFGNDHEDKTKTSQICIFYEKKSDNFARTRAFVILMHFNVILAKKTRNDQHSGFVHNESCRRHFSFSYRA